MRMGTAVRKMHLQARAHRNQGGTLPNNAALLAAVRRGWALTRHRSSRRKWGRGSLFNLSYSNIRASISANSSGVTGSGGRVTASDERVHGGVHGGGPVEIEGVVGGRGNGPNAGGRPFPRRRTRPTRFCRRIAACLAFWSAALASALARCRSAFHACLKDIRSKEPFGARGLIPDARLRARRMRFCSSNHASTVGIWPRLCDRQRPTHVRTYKGTSAGSATELHNTLGPYGHEWAA